MSGLVVLHPGPGRWASRLRQLFPDVEWLGEEQAAQCSAVLVIDDAGGSGRALLRRAAALRHARPGLPVAVLSTLGGGEGPLRLLQALAPCSTGLDGDSRLLLEAMLVETGEARLNIHAQAINVEYDA